MQTQTEVQAEPSAICTATLTPAAGRQLKVTAEDEPFEIQPRAPLSARTRGTDHIDSPLHD